jgi:transposase, IS6 family
MFLSEGDERKRSASGVNFFLSAFRDRESAQILFRRALRDGAPQPRVINTDFAPTYPTAITGLKRSGILRQHWKHRPVQFLNNIIEQDHRAIKRRVNAKQGFRAFAAARRTVDGYEAMHRIRKKGRYGGCRLETSFFKIGLSIGCSV